MNQYLKYLAGYILFLLAPMVCFADYPSKLIQVKHQVKLQLSNYHQFQFAGFYAAVNQGYYSELGIETILLEGDQQKDTVGEVLSEKADFGVTNSEVILHRLNGRPVVVLAAIFQHSPSVLITRKSSEITNPQDMLGRSVKIVDKYKNADILAMFLNEGININQVNFIHDRVSPDDFMDPYVDVFGAYSFNEPYYLIEKNITYTIINPQSYGIDFYGDCLFTSETNINKDSDIVKSFRDASIKGWRYALDNPNKIIDLILTNYNTTLSRDHLCFQAGKLRDIILPDLVEIGHMNLGRWEQIANTFVKLNMAEPGYSLDEFIYDPNPNNYRHMRQVAFAAILFSFFALAVVCFLLLFNRRLQLEMNRRYQTEKALRESEGRYRILFENMMNGIIVYESREDGKEFICIDFNHEAQHIFGLKREVHLWERAAEIFSGFDRVDVDDLFRQVFKTGRTERCYLSKYKGNQIIQFLDCFIFKLPSGEIVSVYSDETHRKSAEEEVQRSKHFLDNIVNSSPSVIISIDLNFRITLFNAAAEKMFGISESQAKDSLLIDILPDYAECTDYAKESMEAGKTVVREKVKKVYDGHDLFITISVYPIITHEIQGVVIRIDDITDRIRMEETMIQTEKMMSVGGLAAGMAHEINNPLGGILQSAQNIIRRLSTDLPINEQTALECETNLKAIRAYMERRSIFKYLDGIRQSGERAAKIVSNMLGFSRRSESKMAPRDIAELIDRTVELASHDYDLKKNYDFRKIEIIKEYAPNLPKIPCVETEIEQVILNMLRNSAQAMGEKESSNTQPRIYIRIAQDYHMIKIEIEDNGPGMDERIKKRVFEPFFTTKEVGVGTGLGLSVSYFIITNNHKGLIRVDSELGKGTKFTIHLPIIRSY